MSPTVVHLAVAAYVVALVAGLTFLTLFVRTDWYRHPWGRHVLPFTLVIDAMLAEALGVWVFGPYPGRQYVVLGLVWAFAAVMVQRAWVQWRGSRRSRREDADA